jgi:hypothetical protein
VRSPNMARSSLCAVFSLFNIAGIRFCWSVHDHDDDDDDDHGRDHAPRKNSRPWADLNLGLAVSKQSSCLATIQHLTSHIYKAPYIIALLSY